MTDLQILLISFSFLMIIPFAIFIVNRVHKHMSKQHKRFAELLKHANHGYHKHNHTVRRSGPPSTKSYSRINDYYSRKFAHVVTDDIVPSRTDPHFKYWALSKFREQNGRNPNVGDVLFLECEAYVWMPSCNWTLVSQTREYRSEPGFIYNRSVEINDVQAAFDDLQTTIEDFDVMLDDDEEEKKKPEDCKSIW